MIAYRNALPRDRAFIVSAWSASMREAHASGMIAMKRWSDVMHVEIADVLDRPGCTTIVAYAPDETSTSADLYGFVSADTEVAPSLVFYCYVKAAYRRSGIARGLFRALGIDPARHFNFACKTGVVSDLARKIPMAKWTPLAARFPKNKDNARG